jgi:hypothetical protein
MKKFLQNNGLTVGLLFLFLISLVGQIAAGVHVHNEEALKEGRALLTTWAYLSSNHFLSAMFENWESEFLQMALFVVLTVYLRQKGSSESHEPDLKPCDEPKTYPKMYFRNDPFLRWVYEHSLTIVLTLMFLISFVLHAWHSWRDDQESARAAGKALETFTSFLFSSQFWFESFQNWQSEFLSMAVLVYLTIYLRHKGSAQSKAVDAPHDKTD